MLQNVDITNFPNTPYRYLTEYICGLTLNTCGGHLSPVERSKMNSTFSLVFRHFDFQQLGLGHCDVQPIFKSSRKEEIIRMMVSTSFTTQLSTKRRTQDQLYNSSFWPKTFWLYFQSQIMDVFPPKNNIYKFIMGIISNNFGF
jgi:hypothetical protein